MYLNWNFRQEILEIAHYWPVIFIAFLIGSLLGWGVSYILPTSYRAESELNVAYNADAIYRNPDDYKNWQLGELEAFVVSDSVIEGTLSKLRAQDPYWQAVSAEDIRSDIRTYWRNAGKWRLVAERQDPDRATQLTQVWRETIIEQVSDATTKATEMLDLSAQIEASAANKVGIELRTVEITGMRDALQAWRNEYIGNDDAMSLKPLDRWHLQSIAARAASINPAALSLIDQIPAPDMSAHDYIDWVDQMIVVLDDELAIIERQQEEIDLHGVQLEQKLNEASQASSGLTAFLIVEPLSDGLPEAQAVRLSSQMAVIGGILGVIIWGFVWLGRPVRKGKT
jgi:hypothetical protein